MRSKLKAYTTEENDAIVLPSGMMTIDREKKALRLHNGNTVGGYEIMGVKPIIPIDPTVINKGDADIGYYGTILAEDFIDGDALVSSIGFSAGVNCNPDAGWLKFSHYGKVLHVAKKPLKHSLNWEDIYQAGLVYGVNNNGLYPSPVGNGVNQSKIVTINGNNYRVRLIRGGNGDPSTSRGGEWDDLMYRIHASDPTGTFWEQYTNDDIAITGSTGPHTLCMESTTDTAYVVRRGNNNITWYGGILKNTSLRNSTYGWRPVLELI